MRYRNIQVFAGGWRCSIEYSDSLLGKALERVFFHKPQTGALALGIWRSARESMRALEGHYALQLQLQLQLQWQPPA